MLRFTLVFFLLYAPKPFIGRCLAAPAKSSGTDPAGSAGPAQQSEHAAPTTGGRSALIKLGGHMASPASPAVERGDLYVLAVGVSTYRVRDLALLYPAKDARDIVELLSAQQGGLYRKVSARVLTDDTATRDNILDGLEWLQKTATARDVAVLFLAGHGITEPSTGVYYFLPVDANPEAITRTMLAQTEFQNKLMHLQGKGILFLDSCHSGQVFGRVNARGNNALASFVSELHRAVNGVVVFTSSAGYQQSLEAREWGNGAFTLAVLEGLRGRADLDQSGRVTVNMLDLYVSQRVRSLTGNRQTPSTAKPTAIGDFPIATAQSLTNADIPLVH